jgi:hypothetical protein
MGFSPVLRKQVVEFHDQSSPSSSFLAMEDTKSIEAMTHTETQESVNRRQLEVQGEALEAVEKAHGIWQSLKLNKAALV